MIYIGCGGQGQLTKRGKLLIEKGNYAEAVTVLSEAIQRNRADSEAHYQLGIAYSRLRQYNEAAEEFQFSLSLEPNREDVGYEFGKVAWLLGRRAIALREFRSILESSASDEQVREIMEITGEIHPVIQSTKSSYDNGSPVFSPDGSKIAFRRTKNRINKILIIDANGSNEVVLTPEGFSDSTPYFSPDGKKIIFSSYQGDSSGSNTSTPSIFVMDITGNNRQRLFENPEDALNPAYSPDGKKVIFQMLKPISEVGTRTEDDWEIYAVDVTGKNLKRLTENKFTDASPKFSPDGKKLVFISNRDGNYEIYTMNTDGSEQTRLTNNSATDLAPSFSPDGTKIIFVSDRDGDEEIYMMNTDGAQQQRLTNSDGKDTTPAFSPDGQKIVFASVRDASYIQICIMDLSRTLTRAELLARVQKQIKQTW
jgi:Tol biopolymer transport system component